MFCTFVKTEMENLTLNIHTIDKFFGYLFNLDKSSKKKLIIRLTESIQSKKINSIDLKSLYGAWDDNRDADEIIKYIKQSRVNSRSIEKL